MSKCDVFIELETKGTRGTGDDVRGHVILSANADVEAKNVRVELQWYTHGRGNRTTRSVARADLGAMSLVAGEHRRAPFTLHVPGDGPVTFHGNLVNLDWRVHAEVDLPWAIDPKGDEDFFVEAGRGFNAPAVLIGSTLSKRGRGCVSAFLALFMAPFIIGGLTAVVVGLVQGNLFFIAWGAVFGGFPGLLLFGILRKALALRMVDGAKLVLEPAAAGPGDDVRITVQLPARLEGKIAGGTARLVCEEVAVSGSGTNATTHRHNIVELPIDVRREPGDLGPRLRGKLTLPALPLSFEVPSNKVLTWIELSAEVKGQPDPVWQEGVHVLPRLPGPG